MADLSDVEAGFVSLITAALYPSGSPPSVLNQAVKVYAGWPDPDTLKADLAPTGTNSPPNGPPGALHVSVYPRPQERNVTRYPRRWVLQAAQPHTYTASISGLVLTIGGAAPNPFYAHNIAVLVNGQPYAYQTSAGQSASDVAAAIQAFIGAYVAGVTVSGAAVSFASGTRLGYARVGTGGVVQREVKRQDRQFQISIWADSPASRTALAKIIDPLLAVTDFMTLADGTSARLVYMSAPEIDADQKQGIYRRDLVYCAEYPTIQTSVAPEIVVADLNLYDQFDNLMYTNDPGTPVFSNSLDFSDPRNSFEIPNV